MNSIIDSHISVIYDDIKEFNRPIQMAILNSVVEIIDKDIQKHDFNDLVGNTFNGIFGRIGLRRQLPIEKDILTKKE